MNGSQTFSAVGALATLAFENVSSAIEARKDH
jgi:hypothetical protein